MVTDPRRGDSLGAAFPTSVLLQVFRNTIPPLDSFRPESFYKVCYSHFVLFSSVSEMSSARTLRRRRQAQRIEAWGQRANVSCHRCQQREGSLYIIAKFYPTYSYYTAIDRTSYNAIASSLDSECKTIFIIISGSN